MRNRFAQFMQGRYGMDQLSRFMMIAGLIVVVIASFIRNPASLGNFIYLLGVLMIILGYARALSRNYQSRYAENQKYMQMTAKIRHSFSKEKNIMEQRKIYRIYTCPGCKQKIRVPKGKGKIEISCPKCSTKFIKRT